jgi:hypothetical protein
MDDFVYKGHNPDLVESSRFEYDNSAVGPSFLKTENRGSFIPDSVQKDRFANLRATATDTPTKPAEFDDRK